MRASVPGFLMLLFGFFCLPVETSGESAKKPVPQTGLASWYRGKGDSDVGTAAHRTLPMGAYVRVTNLRNNKSVVVRINDRGPFIKGRIIDLNRHAAGELSMLKSGTVRVRVEVVSKPQPGS